MPIVSAVGGMWADALDPIVQFRVDQGFQRRPSLINSLYNVQGSTRAYEQISGVGAIGIDAWQDYENAKRIPEVSFDQGYKQTYTHREYIVDFGIERKTNDDADFATVFRTSERIGDSAALFREVEAAKTFNNAFTTATGGDAVALCSDSHPLNPNKSSIVQDNNFALALNKDNVRIIREAMMAFTDDNRNKMAVTPTLLLVPPPLEDTALEIVNSVLNPDNANNTINPQYQRFRVMVWHYLTDSNAWFMIDESLMRMSLDWFNRVPFSVYLRDGDDRTVMAYWRAYQRFSYGFSDWKWVAGSNPS